ncbi:MAG: O-antigen ligase family protein [Betaproteobacteria bacterium]|nr:O-antigen ligase family protein [Betaproteobacteria bacterium]
MAATSLPLREPQSNAGLTLGLAALVALGAAMGVGLVFGELESLWVSLAIIACIAVLYDFRAGAVMAILLLPLSESSVFPHALFGITGLNPFNLLLAASLASFLLHGRVKAAGAFVPKPLLWLYIVPLVLAGLMGSRHAEEIAPVLYDNMAIHFLDAPGYLRDVVFKPMLTVLTALLIGAAVARSKKPERFLVAIGFSIAAICLLSIWYVVRSGMSLQELADVHSREFFAGIGMHSNSLGRLCAVGYAMLLFGWAESRDRAFRLACLAGMALVVVALTLTFSRGAFVGFFIVNALFFLWRFNAKTAALVLLAGVAVIVAAPEQVFERISMGFETGDLNEISAGRIDTIWLPVLPEIWKSPLIGQGLGSTMWSDAMRHGLMLEVTHPHNAYLEALLDVGVVGLGILLAYFWHVWKQFRALGSNAFLTPEMRGFYQGSAAGLLSFLVTGFAGSSLAPLPETAFLWMAIGMMYGQLARRPATSEERVAPQAGRLAGRSVPSAGVGG